MFSIAFLAMSSKICHIQERGGLISNNISKQRGATDDDEHKCAHDIFHCFSKENVKIQQLTSTPQW